VPTTNLYHFNYEPKLTMKKSAQNNLPSETSLPSQDQLAYDLKINHRAYELWEAAGGHHGEDVRHWLEAEREMKTRRQSTKLV